MTKEEAKKQLGRLSRLAYFPATESAMEDMIEAIMSAPSVNIAAAAVKTFLDTADTDTKCPMPAQVRGAIHGIREGLSPKTKCPHCDGNGLMSVPILVTYKANTFKIQNSERLSIPLDEVIEFRKRLGKDQEVLSGAVPCVCMPMTHTIYTEGR